MLQNGDQFYPAMLEAIRDAQGHDQLRGLHLRARRDRPPVHGRVHGAGARGGRGADPARRVRLVASCKRRHRQELMRRRREGGAIPPARRAQSGARSTAAPTGEPSWSTAAIGFTGGAAISKKWAGNVRTPHEWRDSMTRVTGPLVNGIQSAFASNWIYCMRRGDRRAQRSIPPHDRGPGPCGVSVVSSPSDAHAADPAALLAQLQQRPRAAVDLQLLLHPRPASARRRSMERARERRGRPDPGAGQSHRRDPGAARRAGATTRSCWRRASGSSSFSPR